MIEATHTAKKRRTLDEPTAAASDDVEEYSQLLLKYVQYISNVIGGS